MTGTFDGRSGARFVAPVHLLTLCLSVLLIAALFHAIASAASLAGVPHAGLFLMAAPALLALRSANGLLDTIPPQGGSRTASDGSMESQTASSTS